MSCGHFLTKISEKMGPLKKIKYSVVYNRKGQTNRNESALVQIRAYQNAKNRYFSTGIYIEPEHWDERNKRVGPSHPNSSVFNNNIQTLLHRLEDFETKGINRFGFFPVDRLQEFLKKDLLQDYPNFTVFFLHHLKTESMKPNTRKMYWLTFRKLNEFRPTVYFEELTFSFVRDFDRFLSRKKFCQGTIYKHHTRLKTLIHKAINEDLLSLDNNPYKSFKLRAGEPERPYLSPEELTRLEQATIYKGEEHLERIRDIFLFSCYTGLRFSDVTRLTLNQVKRTGKGLVLDLKAEKTGKDLLLPLFLLFPGEEEGPTRPERILEKHTKELMRWEDSEEVKAIPFFQITNQYFNRELKALAKKARITGKLSAHAARRTFASFMATRVKVPVIQKLLQHSTPNMTNIYIQLGTQVIEEELKKVEW